MGRPPERPAEEAGNPVTGEDAIGAGVPDFPQVTHQAGLFGARQVGDDGFQIETAEGDVPGFVASRAPADFGEQRTGKGPAQVFQRAHGFALENHVIGEHGQGRRTRVMECRRQGFGQCRVRVEGAADGLKVAPVNIGMADFVLGLQLDATFQQGITELVGQPPAKVDGHPFAVMELADDRTVKPLGQPPRDLGTARPIDIVHGPLAALALDGEGLQAASGLRGQLRAHRTGPGFDRSRPQT